MRYLYYDNKKKREKKKEDRHASGIIDIILCAQKLRPTLWYT